MNTHRVYCPTLERKVRVYVWLAQDGDEPHDLPGIVCVDHGEACFGARCPLFDLPDECVELDFEWT